MIQAGSSGWGLKSEAKFGVALSAVTLLALVAGGCARSQSFKRDQEYVQDTQSYYERGGASGKQQTARLARALQPKKRVAVLGFWNDTPVRVEDLGPFASDELKRGLYTSQRVIVPTDLKTDKSTEDFLHPSQRILVAQLIREGKRLGVAMVVIGKISRIVFRQKGDDIGVFRQKTSLAAVDVEMKVFDINSGREIMAIGKSGEATTTATAVFESENLESTEYRAELARLAVRDAVTAAVPDVARAVDKMTWEGAIAKIVGAKVYLNSGKASGLVAGDILRVLTQGDDIYDPATGAFLGRTKGQLKGTLEVSDFIGADSAVAEVHTGGNFQEGDAVQLY